MPKGNQLKSSFQPNHIHLIRYMSSFTSETGFKKEKYAPRRCKCFHTENELALN